MTLYDRSERGGIFRAGIAPVPQDRQELEKSVS